MAKKPQKLPVVSQQRLRKLVKDVSIPWHSDAIDKLDKQISQLKEKLLNNRAMKSLERKRDAAWEAHSNKRVTIQAEKRSLLALIDLAQITPELIRRVKKFAEVK